METIRVGSLGAGVQSSTMIFLCNDGLIKAPDFWVFSDTMAEPESVYSWLNYLKSVCRQEIIITCKGDIAKDTLSGSRFASIPFYIKKSEEVLAGEVTEWRQELSEFCQKYQAKWSTARKILREKPKQIVMGQRQCTAEYKIKQIQKCVRERLGYKKGQIVKHKVEMLLGISTDEIQRMKLSREKWIENVYPLIDLDWSRKDCYKYFDDRSKQRPPRSACWMCPFKTDKEWLHDKENNPKEFKLAIEFDAKIRTLPKFKHQNFLHKSCKPLGEVRFKQTKVSRQISFLDECEGMCGI